MSIADQFGDGFFAILAQTMPTHPPAAHHHRGRDWFLIAATVATLLTAVTSARGSTTVLARSDLEPEQPLWSFIDSGSRLHAGDVILCRGDATEPACPWFSTTVLAVEIDGSVLIMQPLGQGVSKLVQLPSSQIVDIARPRKATP